MDLHLTSSVPQTFHLRVETVDHLGFEVIRILISSLSKLLRLKVRCPDSDTKSSTHYLDSSKITSTGYPSRNSFGRPISTSETGVVIKDLQMIHLTNRVP